MGEVSEKLVGPVPLTDEHDFSEFRCDRQPVMAEWLKKNALRNQHAASTTYVVCVGSKVVGYYCLAAGSIRRELAVKSMQRNMPDMLPVFVLGRLAVHSDWEGNGIGSGMLKDAVLRSIELTKVVAARALLCHAIDDEVKAFYLRHGFLEAVDSDPRTMMISLKIN